MAFDLDTAKKRLGIAAEDTTQDAAITAALATALGLAEKYCDRRFMFAADTESFFQCRGQSVTLRRYPVKAIDSIAYFPDNDLDPPDYYLAAEYGILTFKAWFMGTGLDVTYQGGYEQLPPELEAALWFIFDSVWAMTPGMGLEAGDLDGSSGSAPVKGFGINGVRLDYDTTAGESGATASGGDVKAHGLIPASAIAVLDLYRAEGALSGA